MNEEIFGELSKIVMLRRPTWTFTIEDSLVRIAVGYFCVDWEIIDEILTLGNYNVEEVIMHSSLGQVVCIRYTGGK